MSTGIGPFIRTRREEVRLTQTELANAVRMPKSHLSEIERGKIGLPNADVRRRLAKALGVTHLALLIAAGELLPEEIEQAGARGVVADNPDDPRTLIHGLVDVVNWWGRPDRIEGITSQLERWAESDRFIKEVF